MDKLSKTLAEVDVDLARNCTLLNKKIQSLEKTHASLASVNHSSVGLQTSTPIFDDNGVQVSTLGRVMQDNVDLRRANDQLKDQIESLFGDVTAQGGVVLCRFMFTSKLQLLALCMKECPNGDAFSAFVDPMVIFCHDASYVPLIGCKAVKDDDAAVPKHLWLIGYVAHWGSRRLGKMLPWRCLGN